MINYVSTTITDYLIRKEVVDQAKKDIYKYGVLVLIVNMLGIVEVLFLGAITNTFSNSIIFMTSFSLLRSFTGGFHFKHYIPCNISMAVIYLTVIGIHLNGSSELLLFLNFGCIVSLIFICFLSPVIHVNKRLDKQKKTKNKIISIVLAIVLAILAFYVKSFSIVKYAIIVTALLQIITLGGRDYVK